MQSGRVKEGEHHAGALHTCHYRWTEAYNFRLQHPVSVLQNSKSTQSRVMPEGCVQTAVLLPRSMILCALSNHANVYILTWTV